MVNISVESQHREKNISVAAILMVKNEEKRIGVTIDSLVDKVDAIIVFDTGSSDATIKVITDHVDTKIPLHIHPNGLFDNYGDSINRALDYANTVAAERGYDYLLIMDANDELRGSLPMRKACTGEGGFVNGDKVVENKALNDDDAEKDDGNGFVDAYYIERRLQYGPADCDYIQFSNLKLLRRNCPMRCVGKIHEYLAESEPIRKRRIAGDVVHIYQNRVLDEDGRTMKRFPVDKEVLLREHESDPTNTRTVFYLAQTYASLGEARPAYEYYSKRYDMGGYFEEEIFYSAYQCAVLAQQAGFTDDIAIDWCFKALAIDERAEPMTHLARLFRDRKQFHLAYSFAHQACLMDYPANKLLFVDARLYEYLRWHELSISAWYVANSSRSIPHFRSAILEEGKYAAVHCLKSGIDVDVNKSNLKFYGVVFPVKEKIVEEGKEKEEGEIINQLSVG